MKTIQVVIAAFLLPLSSIASASDFRSDDAMDSSEKRVLDSTVTLFRKSQIRVSGDKVILKGTKIKDRFGLCSGEQSGAQISHSFCSGALISPRHVLTSAHCVKTQKDCNATVLAFGPSRRLAADEVYQCRRITAAQRQGVYDWAVIELDRSVPNREPLEVETQSSLREGDPLLIIGSSFGLPTKIVTGSVTTLGADYLGTNVNGSAGHQGMPVLNARTLKIEGILSWGLPDTVFVRKENCSLWSTYPDGQERKWGARTNQMNLLLPALWAN